MNREAAEPFSELEERLRFESVRAEFSAKFLNLPDGGEPGGSAQWATTSSSGGAASTPLRVGDVVSGGYVTRQPPEARRAIARKSQ